MPAQRSSDRRASQRGSLRFHDRFVLAYRESSHGSGLVIAEYLERVGLFSVIAAIGDGTRIGTNYPRVDCQALCYYQKRIARSAFLNAQMLLLLSRLEHRLDSLRVRLCEKSPDYSSPRGLSWRTVSEKRREDFGRNWKAIDLEESRSVFSGPRRKLRAMTRATHHFSSSCSHRAWKQHEISHTAMWNSYLYAHIGKKVSCRANFMEYYRY